MYHIPYQIITPWYKRPSAPSHCHLEQELLQPVRATLSDEKFHTQTAAKCGKVLQSATSHFAALCAHFGTLQHFENRPHFAIFKVRTLQHFVSKC
jgi:hypothetical protein